jgi:hypothetical protein
MEALMAVGGRKNPAKAILKLTCAGAVVAATKRFSSVVMPGLDPGMHSVAPKTPATVTEWIAGSSPAMTTVDVAARRAVGLVDNHTSD